MNNINGRNLLYVHGYVICKNDNLIREHTQLMQQQALKTRTAIDAIFVWQTIKEFQKKK